MCNSNMLNLVSDIINANNFSQDMAEMTIDVVNNPQFVININNNIFYFTHNLAEGRYYFSCDKLDSILIIDRIVKYCTYINKDLTIQDSSKLQLSNLFKSYCIAIVRNLKDYNSDYTLR